MCMCYEKKQLDLRQWPIYQMNFKGAKKLISLKCEKVRDKYLLTLSKMDHLDPSWIT